MNVICPVLIWLQLYYTKLRKIN